MNIFQSCLMPLDADEHCIRPKKTVDVSFIGKVSGTQLDGNLICDLIDVHLGKHQDGEKEQREY